MSNIVVAILTKNEAGHIGDCLKTVQWADLITLEDSFSDDGTVEIAQELGAKVIQSEFINFAIARNNALKNAKILGAEWLFFVDADERVTPELAEEIRQVIEKEETVGWWVPRYNIMWGHIMQGGGWYPDYQLRLMKVEVARYDPEREVHETVILNGPADYLKQHLIHYNYDSLAHFKRKQDRYIDFEAKILKDRGVRAKPWTYLTMPLREFRRRYISLAGYKDGWVGLQVCSLMSWYMFLTYVRLYKLQTPKAKV
jgi:hypothetical protein